MKSWPTGLMTTSAECFLALHGQLTRREIDEPWLKGLEWTDNLFPNVNYRYWKPEGGK
jgi:predicted glycosyl hydrolase (DUF1957 family)